MIPIHLSTPRQPKTLCRIRQWKISVCVLVCCIAMQMFSPSLSYVFASDPPADTDAQETYVMISFAWGMGFFAWSFAGMYDAAALLGPHVRVEWHGPQPLSQEEASLEANVMKAIITRNVAGIVVSTADKNLLKPVIDEAIDAGIPVMCFDSDVPESKRLALVATDNYHAGYLAGTTMAEWLNGREGSVGVVTIANAIHMENRLRGFKEGLASMSPGTELFVITSSGGFGDPVVNDYKILLKAHPDMIGIFCPWDRAGIGAVQAVRDFNLTGAIQILSFDFGPRTIAAVEQGEIRALVAQNPYLMGYYSLLLAYNAAHPTDILSKHQGFGDVPASIDTGVTIIGKTEAARYKNIPKVAVDQDPPLIYGFEDR